MHLKAIAPRRGQRAMPLAYGILHTSPTGTQ